MKTHPLRAAAGALALTLVPAFGFAEELPRGEASAAGLVPERLAALDARLSADIEAGKYPGGIITILKGGEIVHQTTLGRLTAEGEEMPEDAIFRIYSMTKPIVSVAALRLMEQGRLNLAAPVSAYIPEFADAQVGVEEGDGLTLKKPARAATVQDLMRHTAGVTYGFFGAGKVRDAYREAKIWEVTATGDNAAHAALIASLPLEHEPGTTWEYSRSTDLLGRVVEVVSGKNLEAALQELVLGPLDMRDTGFHAPEGSHARLAEPLEGDGVNGPLFDQKEKPSFESGGGGLVSTARDYARFAQMLLNGGELDGARLLSPSTVAFMTSDHTIAAGIKPGKYYLPGPGAGFGLGVGVRIERGVASYNAPVGTYWWGGAAGTYWFNVPSQDMSVIWMMQSPKNRVPVRAVLHDMVQAAIAE